MSLEISANLKALKLAAELAREAFHAHKTLPTDAAIEDKIVWDVAEATLREASTRARIAYDDELKRVMAGVAA